jgi:hypothetical protein
MIFITPKTVETMVLILDFWIVFLEQTDSLDNIRKNS